MNPYNFRMPTHVASMSADEERTAKCNVEYAYEAVLETLLPAATKYAMSRAAGTSDDEFADCVVQLQMKYLRHILAGVNAKLNVI